MGYTAGLLDKRVTILNKAVPDSFGQTTRYEADCTVWAGVTWSKGVKALHEGAFDAYDVILVRMRYTCKVSRDSRLKIEGKTYQILSLNSDRRANQIQITAQEIVV